MPEQAIWRYRNSKAKLLHKQALLRDLSLVANSAETYKQQHLFYAILPLCLEKDKDVRLLSWKAALATFALVDNCDLFAIDGIMRNLNVTAGSPGSIAQFAPPTEICGLLSMNRDGRVRQAAVEALVQCVTGKELPFLLLRLTDWGEPVQSLAAAAIEERITMNSYLPHFIDRISLLPRLWQSTRYRLERIRDALEKELAPSILPTEPRWSIVDQSCLQTC